MLYLVKHRDNFNFIFSDTVTPTFTSISQLFRNFLQQEKCNWYNHACSWR